MSVRLSVFRFRLRRPCVGGATIGGLDRTVERRVLLPAGPMSTEAMIARLYRCKLSRLRRNLLRGQPQTSDWAREEIRVYEDVYEYVGGSFSLDFLPYSYTYSYTQISSAPVP